MLRRSPGGLDKGVADSGWPAHRSLASRGSGSREQWTVFCTFDLASAASFTSLFPCSGLPAHHSQCTGLQASNPTPHRVHQCFISVFRWQVTQGPGSHHARCQDVFRSIPRGKKHGIQLTSRAPSATYPGRGKGGAAACHRGVVDDHFLFLDGIGSAPNADMPTSTRLQMAQHPLLSVADLTVILHPVHTRTAAAPYHSNGLFLLLRTRYPNRHSFASTSRNLVQD